MQLWCLVQMQIEVEICWGHQREMYIFLILLGNKLKVRGQKEGLLTFHFVPVFILCLNALRLCLSGASEDGVVGHFPSLSIISLLLIGTSSWEQPAITVTPSATSKLIAFLVLVLSLSYR